MSLVAARAESSERWKTSSQAAIRILRSLSCFVSNILLPCRTLINFNNMRFVHFTEPALSRLNNAEYASFISRFMGYLPLAEETTDENIPDELDLDDPELGAPALAIPAEIVSQMKTLLSQLMDLTKQTRSSVETKKMNDLEKQRDAIATFITNRVYRSSTLPMEAEKEAGELLYNTLNPYLGMPELPLNQETITIKGLLKDLRKEEFAEAVVTLGVVNYMNELERVNNAYEELSVQRTSNNALQRASAKSRELRTEMNGLYTDMTDLAFASNVLNPSEESAAFIRDVNNLIAETQATRNLRDSGTSSDNAESDQPAEL